MSISPLFLKDIFTGYRILGWICLLSTFEKCYPTSFWPPGWWESHCKVLPTVSVPGKWHSLLRQRGMESRVLSPPACSARWGGGGAWPCLVFAWSWSGVRCGQNVSLVLCHPLEVCWLEAEAFLELFLVWCHLARHLQIRHLSRAQVRI